MDSFSHIAYSDESSYNSSRFPSIAIVSLRNGNQIQIEEELRVLLKDSNVDELKWVSIRSARKRFAALKVANLVMELAVTGRLRVDVLSWDSHVPSDLKTRRGPVEYLSVMYYHLMRTVFNRRWPQGSKWLVHVDEHSGVDWQLLRNLTNITGFDITVWQAEGAPVFDRIDRFEIVHLGEGSSHLEPLIQVADLFAGISSFSRAHAKRFRRWEKAKTTRSLIGGGFSGSERERFKLLEGLNRELQRHSLNVSFGDEGLRTYNPGDPINFWPWSPKAAIQARQSKLTL